ncbi:Protein Iojap-related [Vigna angularis]|uniref:Protein Iojap-related n=1 Tax=Phaseolus angularis TaxID=3914 RepID=A0A8T0KBG7_PHAAN|nr:Protein Iojap-related [Vigna angularis]
MWGLLRTRTCLRYSKALLLHQPWKKKVGLCSLSAVDGRNCLLDLPEIEKVLMDIKADDVKVIPVPKHCDWADFMVLATGRSTWHVKNIAQALIYKAPHPPSFGLGYVLDVPGGPASGENHEIGPIAVLGNRYHLNVVSFDIHQNLLDLRQI